MGIILLVVIVLFVVAYNVYLYYRKIPKANSANSVAGKTAELLFFYTDWCPHCTSAKPEWNTFKTQTTGTQINGYTITFNDVNCTKETPESESMMEKYKVDGYPTIKLLANNKVYDFDAKPTKQNLTQFVNTSLN